MRKKSERCRSKLEFESAAEKICRRVYEDAKYNFGIVDEPDRVCPDGSVHKGYKKYTENKEYIERTKEQMYKYAEMIDYYVQAADSHYPHNMDLLTQRRIMQDHAIAACRSLKRRYQINLDCLGVPKKRYHETVELIEHEIIVITGWRKSDHRWEDKIRENDNIIG